MTQDTHRYVGLTCQNNKWKIAHYRTGSPIIEPDRASAIVRARRNVTTPLQGDELYEAVTIQTGSPADLRNQADLINEYANEFIEFQKDIASRGFVTQECTLHNFMELRQIGFDLDDIINIEMDLQAGFSLAELT